MSKRIAALPEERGGFKAQALGISRGGRTGRIERTQGFVPAGSDTRLFSISARRSGSLYEEITLSLNEVVIPHGGIYSCY